MVRGTLGAHSLASIVHVLRNNRFVLSLKPLGFGAGVAASIGFDAIAFVPNVTQVRAALEHIAHHFLGEEASLFGAKAFGVEQARDFGVADAAARIGFKGNLHTCSG